MGIGSSKKTIQYLDYPSEPSQLSEEIKAELEPKFEGSILIPQDKEAYDAARDRGFNKAYIQFPVAICQIQSIDDIKTVMAYAIEKDIPFVFFCGGHGCKYCLENTIVIDLVHWRNIEVNPENKTVKFQSGCVLGDVDAACAEHNLAVPFGTYPNTGATGLTLNGGWGWFGCLHGLSCENVIEFECILADGTFVTVNEDSYSDLFWALRGGGGHFACVVSFTCQAHPMPEQVLFGFSVYLAPTKAQAKTILKWWLNRAKDLPAETSSGMVIPGKDYAIPTMWANFSGELDKKKIPILVESESQGQWSGPWCVAKDIKPCDYTTEVQTALVDKQQPGHLYEVASSMNVTDDNIDEIISILLEGQRGKLAGKSDAIIIFPRLCNQGKVVEGLPHSLVGGDFWVVCMSYFTNETERVRSENWVLDLKSKIKKFTFSWLNHANSHDVDTEIGDSEILGRLKEIKQKYDINNVFAYGGSYAKVINADCKPKKEKPLVENDGVVVEGGNY